MRALLCMLCTAQRSPCQRCACCGDVHPLVSQTAEWAGEHQLQLTSVFATFMFRYLVSILAMVLPTSPFLRGICEHDPHGASKWRLKHVPRSLRAVFVAFDLCPPMQLKPGHQAPKCASCGTDLFQRFAYLFHTSSPGDSNHLSACNCRTRWNVQLQKSRIFW